MRLECLESRILVSNIYQFTQKEKFIGQKIRHQKTLVKTTALSFAEDWYKASEIYIYGHISRLKSSNTNFEKEVMRIIFRG